MTTTPPAGSSATHDELVRFLHARDFLVTHRTDFAAAQAGFRWPQLSRFNWALDYFDHVARDNPAPALLIIEENGARATLSYAELSRRSTQVANFLAAQGAGRGDRVLLMLGNEVPLWETMLAAIKLGLVVIPATALLAGADLADRMERGKVRHVITHAGGAAKFADLSPALMAGVTRICVPAADGSVADGWITIGIRRTVRPSCLVARPRRPPIRCSNTSRRAPPPSPSSCSTRSRAIRSGTCRRCTGWV